MMKNRTHFLAKLKIVKLKNLKNHETEKSCVFSQKKTPDASVLTTAVNARWPTYLT